MRRFSRTCRSRTYRMRSAGRPAQNGFSSNRRTPSGEFRHEIPSPKQVIAHTAFRSRLPKGIDQLDPRHHRHPDIGDDRGPG